jgi:hypothetical protein
VFSLPVYIDRLYPARKPFFPREAFSVDESREENEESEFMTKFFAFVAVFAGCVIQSSAQEKQALRLWCKRFRCL